MLSELSIRNFAIIDDLQLHLGRGMTVLSGETGAGKSILIDALGLLLGDRAESDAVRDGAQRAEVNAVFSLADCAGARAWLTERELAESDGDDECILRRVVRREGRSRNWINGAPVPARDLAELGAFLVDIHGQHAHQSLLRAAVQRQVLDAYADHDTTLDAVADTHARYTDLTRQLRTLTQTDASGASRLELLRYQVGELDALAPRAEELDALEAEHRRLANAERLITDGRHTLGLLYEDEDAAAVNLLGAAEKTLVELAGVDEAFNAAADLAANARIQTGEAAEELRRVLDRLDLDPARLAEIDARLSELQDVARKHQCRPQDLPELHARLADELNTLENAEGEVERLTHARDAALDAYRDHAARLHAARVDAGQHMAAAVSEVIRELGMPQGEFAIDVEADADAAPTAHGTDRVRFLVSANPGQAARAIEKVASGGELSRISLGIQVVAAADTRIPTLVFDEVDAGIGGGVAEIVGRLLRRLGESRQALCVTHLPQVAAQARNHLRVAKSVVDGSTRTRIQPLDADQRVDEIARMLGGVQITHQTTEHAREMLARAEADTPAQADA